MQTQSVEAAEVSAPIKSTTSSDTAADERRDRPEDEKPRERPRLRFNYFRRKVAAWWKILAALFVAVPTVLAIAFTGYSLTQKVIIIEPLSIPKVMADNGYTPEIAAAHFRSAISRAMLATELTVPSVALRGDLPDIIVPSVGISAQTIESAIRRLLPISRGRIISGEFTVVDDRLWLRLLSGGREIYSSPRGVSPGRVRQLMDAAVPAVLREVWPTYNVLTLVRTDPNRALKVADQIIATEDPLSTEVSQVHILKGMIYAHQKQFNEALTSFGLVSKAEHQVAKHFMRGIVFRMQSEPEQARDEFAKSEGLAKDDPFMLAFVRVANGRSNSETIAELQRYRNVDLKFGIHTRVGLIFYQLGMFDEAITEYQEAIKIDASDIGGIREFGILLFR